MFEGFRATIEGARLVQSRVRNYYTLVALIAAMFAAEATMHFTHYTWSRWLVTITAGVAVLLAFGAGLKTSDLGLDRRTYARGSKWAAIIILVVVAGIAVAIAIPPLRELFQNDAYSSLRWALFSAFVLIPLQTVIPEELLFRGIITGSLLRRLSTRVSIAIQAGLFGLWHVVSSLGLTAGNAGFSDAVGTGALGISLGIVGAVAFTATAGAVLGWLRVKTDSLLPCIALHWAANGAGAIAAALAWQLA
ncbi:CPBP family intramembrane glutamic endopeptidase [Gordonia sp. (in: high G+C Gram-positive bacteria)]|uniref:CPBP family intramembrane glutamic endopeptidase n=1 Tax=Gordonia sp. (in: high G+C Gram-positive bacteria) TaxID=84139 RepID=UPI0025C08F06|nr:CPBP family intramembrane glutamic endopeptidase [Gordonia sp. (in: high G+C Gram-positive bacteria)]